MYIMAGYPWLNVRSRDELIALPGCTLSIKHANDYEQIMKSLLEALRRFCVRWDKRPHNQRYRPAGHTAMGSMGYTAIWPQPGATSRKRDVR